LTEVRVVVLIAAVFLVCWTLAWFAARALVVQVRLPERADALLVLAGAPVYFERIAHAGDLYLGGRAGTVLLTNDGIRGSWSRTLQRNPYYYERATLRLTQAGVPPEHIQVLPGPRVRSTYDEAKLVRAYVEAHPTSSILIVTSPYHTRRALWSLRHVLDDLPVQIGVEPAPSPEAPSEITWWLHRRGWQTVAAEYVKLAYYMVHY